MRSTTRGPAIWLAAGTIALAACSGPATPPPTTGSPPAPPAVPTPSTPRPAEYVDTEYGYRLVPPPGWRATPPSPQQPAAVTALFVRPAPDSSAGVPFQVNMNVVVSPTAAGLDENATGAKQQLPGVLPDYRAVLDERTELSGGRPAHLLGATYTQQGMRLRNLQLITVADGRSYVVTATTPEAGWQRYADEIRDSLLSLSVGD